jgi:predicted ATP-dependent protease
VIIPAANQVHLMLDTDVRAAVKAGKFHIYTADHIEEVMALLSGLVPGKINKKGLYTAGSFNRKVCNRIEEFQELRRHYGKHGGDDKEGSDDN